MPDIRHMTDFEIVSNLRMYDSRPRSSGYTMSANDRQRSAFRSEANRRGIDTYSTTSNSLGYPMNIGHIRYKDGSVLHNRKVR